MLTEKTVRVSDRRVQFLSLDAFKAAGGIVLRDLFTEDNGGWIGDVALLDSLVHEKLKAEAAEIANEGWKWVEVAVDFPYGHSTGLRELDHEIAGLSDEEEAALAALRAEADELESTYADADELPDDVDERLGEIETAIAAFDHDRQVFEPFDGGNKLPGQCLVYVVLLQDLCRRGVPDRPEVSRDHRRAMLVEEVRRAAVSQGPLIIPP